MISATPKLRIFAHARRFVLGFRDEQRGQAIVITAVMMVALLCMAGFAIDVARCMYTYRELQSATDAAALAGASQLPAASSVATATSYSAVAGSKNANNNLTGVAMLNGYPKVECLTTLIAQGSACSAPDNGNAIEVKEQVVIPLYFLKLLGRSTQTIIASATSSMRGSKPVPLNVAIILDSTLSMNIYDSDCGATQMTCANNAVQVLLQSLTPCPATQATCTVSNGVASNSVDRVSLFTFPTLDPATTYINTSCTTPVPSNYPSISPYGYLTAPNYGPGSWSGIATTVPFSFPTAGATAYNPTEASGTYQITNFLSDYRTSDTATSLNGSSLLVKAVGGTPSCGGMIPPNYEVLYWTYYAGAIYAAQAALVQQQLLNPGSQNVIIFLSDGDSNANQTIQDPFNNTTYTVMPSPATANGQYPSWVGECGQGITAAKAAAANGTIVYSVAYGSPTTGCSTDANAGTAPNVTPCQTMAAIASAPQYFFSDYNQSAAVAAGNSGCTSPSQSVTSLTAIFQQIANQLTHGRLIPDNTP